MNIAGNSFSAEDHCVFCEPRQNGTRITTGFMVLEVSPTLDAPEAAARFIAGLLNREAGRQLMAPPEPAAPHAYPETGVGDNS